MTEYILNALFGLGIGFLGGYAGIGGAPFLVFMLGTLLDYPQHLAQGTVVAIMLGPMSLPGVWAMRDRIGPLMKYAAIGVVSYAFFSYFGAHLAYMFSNDALRLLFAGLLAGLGMRHILPDNGTSDDGAPAGVSFLPMNGWTMSILGALVGVVGGLFGIGAGVLMVPILIRFFGQHKDDARAISLAILLPPVSVGAVVKYHGQGDIEWMMVLVGFAAYFASNYWGARLGRAENPRRFGAVLGILLLVSAVLYVWKAIF